jgi:hypothetical protein
MGMKPDLLRKYWIFLLTKKDCEIPIIKNYFEHCTLSGVYSNIFVHDISETGPGPEIRCTGWGGGEGDSTQLGQLKLET